MQQNNATNEYVKMDDEVYVNQLKEENSHYKKLEMTYMLLALNICYACNQYAKDEEYCPHCNSHVATEKEKYLKHKRTVDEVIRTIKSKLKQVRFTNNKISVA